MKKVPYILILLAISAVMHATPIQAADGGLNDNGVNEQKWNKDECLLIAINCTNDFITLEKKIERLQREISKGKAIYTDDELRILEEQLDYAIKTLKYFEYEGASNRYK